MTALPSNEIDWAWAQLDGVGPRTELPPCPACDELWLWAPPCGNCGKAAPPRLDWPGLLAALHRVCGLFPYDRGAEKFDLARAMLERDVPAHDVWRHILEEAE